MFGLNKKGIYLRFIIQIINLDIDRIYSQSFF